MKLVDIKFELKFKTALKKELELLVQAVPIWSSMQTMHNLIISYSQKPTLIELYWSSTISLTTKTRRGNWVVVTFAI